MNDFFLHEQLCTLENIANQYPMGQPCGGRIRDTVNRVESRLYRVAVIGEFKKGKSSLINALLGSEILPTDILPMTAAINRVTYGEKRRILVCYKNGEREERTLEELVDFGTKLDERRAAVAREVREIEVHYPSVFCKNRIELIDTPGLNDSEHMTEVTLSILGEVDAAIFVTSAREPLSMTEQESILMLIGQPGIRHMVFVITCIDVFPTEEERERVIETIRERLMENTLSAARERCGEDPALWEKARRILSRPELYAVSSLLAMKGFVRDDEDLLDESRFPEFKSALLDGLTAAQSRDVKERTMEAAEEVCGRLENWYQASLRTLDEEEDGIRAREEAFRSYTETAQIQLGQLFLRMDEALERQEILVEEGRCGEELLARGKKLFIAHLAALRADTLSDGAIRAAIRQAAQEASAMYEGVRQHMARQTREAMKTVEKDLDALRRDLGLPSLREEAESWARQNGILPFSWRRDPIPPLPNLVNVNVIPTVEQALRISLAAFQHQIELYVRAWRVLLLRRTAADRGNQEIPAGLEEQRKKLQIRRSALELSHQRNRQQAEAVRDKLREGMGNQA